MKDCEIYTLNIAQFQEFLKILKKKIEHEGVTKIERSITTVVLWKLARLKQGLKAQLRFLLNNLHSPLLQYIAVPVSLLGN